MERVAILDETTIQTILDTQNRILRLVESTKKTSDSEYVSVHDAAKILKVSEQKIRQMIDEGELEHKRFKRTIRIYKSSLI
jgi:excisionase family DNA binding protein